MRSTSVTRSIGPKEAENIIGESNFKNNRSLRRWHVINLARKMENGDFLHGSVLRFVETPNGITLTDGQHRLSAVMERGKPYEFTLVTVMGETDDDISKDYSSNDIHLKRTAFDYVRARNLGANLGISEHLTNRIFSGIRSLYTDILEIHSSKISNQDLERWTSGYVDEITHYLGLVVGKVSREPFLLRPTVVGCALLTLKHSAEIAEPFWDKIVKDDGLRSGDPCKTLLKYLSRLIYERKVRGQIERAMIVKAVSICWQANYYGKDLARITLKDLKHIIFEDVPLGKLHKINHLE